MNPPRTVLCSDNTTTGENAGFPRVGADCHIPVLDGIRGTAVTMVMLCHFISSCKETILSYTVGHGWVIKSIALVFLKVASFGGQGVDLFFVLSGFLITGILLDTRNSSGYFRRFYARRILRIFPLYYLCLVFLFIVLPWVSESNVRLSFDKQIFYWLYINNYFDLFRMVEPFRIGDFLTGHLWSLAIEEQFYFVWPMIIYFLSQKAAARFISAVVVLSLICRLVLCELGNAGAVYRTTFCRLDPIALGSLVALMSYMNYESLIEKIVVFGSKYINCLMVPVIFLPATFFVRHYILDCFGYTIAAIFFAFFLVEGLMRGTWVNALCMIKPLRFMGKLAYGLYVYHFLLLLQMNKYISVAAISNYTGIVLGLLTYLVLVFFISIIFAYISYNCFEKRILSLKKYL